MPRVAVFGATGHTGRMTVEALVSRGADVLACGRNAEALSQLAALHPKIATRVVDVTDARAVRDALTRADAVANLAGPFLAHGTFAVEAALRRGIPYADTTGEQAFIHLLRRRYDARARESGAPVIPALAFEYAAGDLAACASFPEGGDALHVLYRPGGARPSAGTKKSILRALATPSLGFERGALVRVEPGAFTRTFATAQGARPAWSFGGGDALTVPRHTPFSTVRSYFAGDRRRAIAARMAAPVARLVLRGPVVRAVDRSIDRRHVAPDNTTAHAEVCLAAERGGRERTATLQVGDPYRFTAEVLAEGILHLASHRTLAGVLAPSQAFDAAEFLARVGRRTPIHLEMTGGTTLGLAPRSDETRK